MKRCHASDATVVKCKLKCTLFQMIVTHYRYFYAITFCATLNVFSDIIFIFSPVRYYMPQVFNFPV